MGEDDEEEAGRSWHVRVAPDGFSFAEVGGYACNECSLVLKGVGGCQKHAGTEKCRTRQGR